MWPSVDPRREPVTVPQTSSLVEPDNSQYPVPSCRCGPHCHSNGSRHPFFRLLLLGGLLKSPVTTLSLLPFSGGLRSVVPPQSQFVWTFSNSPIFVSLLPALTSRGCCPRAFPSTSPAMKSRLAHPRLPGSLRRPVPTCGKYSGSRYQYKRVSTFFEFKRRGDPTVGLTSTPRHYFFFRLFVVA